MKAPFVYGKIAEGEEFTNRVIELAKLENNFSYGINTIVISPRRWGKSSLVKKAANATNQKDEKLKVIFLDLFNVKNEIEFYNQYAKAIIHAAGNKVDDALDIVKSFFGKLIPKITYSPDQISEFSIGFNWEELKQNADEILDLPQKIAEQKGFRFLICLDEFQNIETFQDSLALQKKLRSHWQHHTSVSYCLYGSKKHIMSQLFSSASKPFYKFADILFLQKIQAEDWNKFIKLRFEQTNKNIYDTEITKIIELVDLHPQYVQHLSQLVWFNTEKDCSIDIVAYSFEMLMNQMNEIFESRFENLSGNQIRFLKAVCDGISELSSASTILTYRLGTSATITQVKKALEDKEIIDITKNKVEFLDPLFKTWFNRKYVLN